MDSASVFVPAYKNPEATEAEVEITSSNYPEPSARTVAALEFQVASLLNDGHAVVNWPGREVVVNAPGDLAKKQSVLGRIARGLFPKRGDREDVLSKTILEYRLFGWANPFGFWQALKNDMIDAKKSAHESRCVSLETPEASSKGRSKAYEWQPSKSSLGIDRKAERDWLGSEAREAHAETSVQEKWHLAQASAKQTDRLICEALRRVQADAEYMDKLAQSDRETAKLTRIVAEIRSLAGCSQAEAYRLINSFRTRFSTGRAKK